MKPDTKSRSWITEERFEFWIDKRDLGEIDIAAFKILGLEARFEMN